MATTGSIMGREFKTYLPASLCAGRGRQVPLAVPLLVLVHCFGCNADMEISKFAAAAEEFNFALVAPEGVGSSFNAPSCCGSARANNLDDVGFVDALVAHAKETLPILNGAVFASGFSNGGFLVSHLASKAQTHFRGIAPVSGHEYEIGRTKPLPVSIHHCAADEAVLTSGCCQASGCCCGIGRERAECVSTTSLFEKWLRINGCSGTARTADVKGAICLSGVGCAASTSFCSYSNNCFHSQWSHQFPGVHAIGRFFANEACALPDRNWREWPADNPTCAGVVAAKPSGADSRGARLSSVPRFDL